MNYCEELTKAMTWLGEQPDTIFLGQSVGVPGTPIYRTLDGVPLAKRQEMPVTEELQLGMSIGLSLEGFCPVSIFPRWNFLICAMNQLVNHLDALPLYSTYQPKVIIRTAVGADQPLDPGPQHKADYTDGVRKMLNTVPVVRLSDPCEISKAYQTAYYIRCSEILVELGNQAK